MKQERLKVQVPKFRKRLSDRVFLFRRIAMPALAAAAVAVVLHAMGLFALVNGVGFGLLTRVEPALPMTRTLLVEVEARPEAVSPEAAHDVAGRLRDLGAAATIFLWDPANAATGLASDPATVVARPAAEAGGVGAPIGGPASGVLVTPPSDYGVHRRHSFILDLPEGRAPTLPAAGAARAAGLDWEALPAEALLRFPERPEAIPRISAEALLEGRIPRDLVAGRAVVVGADDGQRFVTPMTPDAPLTSVAEYETVALENLLAAETVAELDLWSVAMLVTLACLFATPLYGALGPRQWPLAAIGATALIAVVALALLILADLYIPVGTLLASQALLSLAVWRREEVEQDRELHTLARRVSSDLVAAGRAEAPDAEAWPLLAAMVSRLLGLRRSIFLAPDSSGLRQAAAIGCSAADLAPELLDPAAGPLKRAVEADGPAAVDRTLLRCAEEGESVYAAPLRGPAGGIGFWIFAVEDVEAGRAPALLAAVRRAAELLADQSEDQAGPATKSINGVLARTLRRLEERALLLGDVLDAVSTGAVAFDAAGRVLHMNVRMQSALDTLGAARGALAAPDLLGALSGLPDEEAARITRRVLLQGDEVSLPASKDIEARRHLVRLSPLGASGGAAREGLLLQLVDVTDLAKLASFRRTFSEHLGAQLRNEAEAVQIAAELLGDPRVPEARRDRVLDRLSEAVRRLRARLASADAVLASEPDQGGGELFPLDVLAALRAALERATPLAQRRRIEVETRLPELAGLVMAAPGDLDRLLEDALALLVEDAREGGRVSVTMTETPTQVTIEAMNEGFGAPDERLAAVLSGREEPVSEDLRRLRDGARAAERWGGRLKAASGAGKGFHITLTLARLA